MAAPEIVETLVARFDRNRELYCGSGYNETQLRREFLDPFFEALGWDVDNKRGVSPLYQDVVHEYGTEVEGSQKTADYAFRVGEKVKFFVEAKKPGTRLKDDAGPALQLRRYAYSAGLPLSILTDFEEFAAYDGRVPPKKADAASRARVMYFTYDRYVEAWDEIAAVFSREAVWSGAFDTYAEKTRGGKAEPVDKAFLKLLEGWRDELARNVANRNREKNLNKYELSAAVQAILDRIIFLRVAEDRGIEDRGRLEALQKGEGVYGRLMELCLEADDVYNSGLFHFREEKGRATSRDELTPTLHVDDPILRKIIRELSESPYEFGVVPVEILGQVYEQFLGKTIWLDGRGVSIDYKPEVRKAKGVYYTPQYIVEYIVKNTVGELLKKCKKPKDAAKLKILDPACGSGSFLLGAYQHLVNWHLGWYVDDGPAKHEGKVVPTPGPGPVSWRLTAAAKKDILVNNLFGVDIDPQAVEVTKLSLLLKALEGESRESVGAQTKFLRERILPDLGDNIKCGNSLIGSDYFEGGQTLMSVPQDEEERRRVNPFDWDVEFPKIMKAGGFDAVIGNPPYIQSRYGLLIEGDKNYYYERYKTVEYQLNTYGLFIERGINILKRGGYLGMIVPNYWLSTRYNRSLRELLFFENEVMGIVNTYNVFDGASVDTILLTIKKPRTKKRSKKVSIKSVDKDLTLIKERLRAISEKDWGVEYIYKVSAETSDGLISFCPFVKLKGESFLRDYFVFKKGMQPYELGKGRPAQTKEMMKRKIYHSDTKIAPDYKKLFRGRDVRRYYLDWGKVWICYGKNLAAPRDPSIFEGPRLLFSRIISGGYLNGIKGFERFICNTDVITLKPKPDIEIDLLFFLGVLMSKITVPYLKSVNVNLDRATYPKLNINTLEEFPIPNINLSKSGDMARHDKMVGLVENMLKLHKRLAAAKTNADKKRLERAINATDKKIDALVYELYGLNAEEIKIVESS